MQKGFAPLILLVGILVIIGVAGGAYYFGKFQALKSQLPNSVVTSQTPKPTTSAISPTPTGTDETTNPDSTGANWKEYRTTYYVLNYPSNWNTGIPDMDASEQNLDHTYFGNSSDLYILGISVYGQQSWERMKNLLGLTISSKEGTQEIDFKGIKGFKRQGYFGENGNDYGFIILINSNGKVYQIAALQRTNKGDYTKYIDQILSTFKFTN